MNRILDILHDDIYLNIRWAIVYTLIKIEFWIRGAFY